MSDIESNQRSNTRMDQDNQKNVVTPKAGGNQDAINTGGTDDIDESNRNRVEAPNSDQNEEQRLREDDNRAAGKDTEQEAVPERNK